MKTMNLRHVNWTFLGFWVFLILAWVGIFYLAATR